MPSAAAGCKHRVDGLAGIKGDPTGGVREVRAKKPMASTDRFRWNWLRQEEEEGAQLTGEEEYGGGERERREKRKEMRLRLRLRLREDHV